MKKFHLRAPHFYQIEDYPIQSSRRMRFEENSKKDLAQKRFFANLVFACAQWPMALFGPCS